jgi:hypothetical protein
MLVSRRLATGLALLGLAAAGAAATARVVYPQIRTRLTGPPIEGRSPHGEAKADQSRLPQAPGRLAVRVRNVNLPDDTTLTVNVGGDVAGGGLDVGEITLSGGEGRLLTSLQAAVARGDAIAVLHGRQIVLAGGAPWSVTPLSAAR